MGGYAIGEVATISLGVFNGEGANATANRDSTVLLVGRATARPVPPLEFGVSVARDGPDSLRWGLDGEFEYARATLRTEYVSRHRSGRDLEDDDYGWYVFEAWRLTPQWHLVARQGEFRRPSIGESRRAREFAWGTYYEPGIDRVRLLFEFARRLRGEESSREDTVLGQVQVRF
jgi:hypothetical protein